MSHPPVFHLVPKALDVTEPKHVEIEYDAGRRILYVSVEGVTLFRACEIKEIEIAAVKNGGRITMDIGNQIYAPSQST